MKQIMTRLTALLLALVMTTTLALAANKSGYSDVPDKNWASQSIAQCKQYNLLQGIGGGKFGLGQKMTRAAYAVALCRLMGWKTVTPEKGSYTDNQNAKKWYYSAIETASAHDVFSGHSTTCRPNDPITREEMAAMTVRALGYSTLSGTVQDECPFPDVSTNPGYITLAWRMGLVVGMNLTTFAPKNDTTREQAAAVLLLPLRLRPVRATARPLPRHPPLPLPTVRSFWPRPALRASSAPSLLLLPLTRMSST